jgi:C-terminal processing protease CtpA/Prc
LGRKSLTFRALAAKAKNTREFLRSHPQDAFTASETSIPVYSPEEKFDWWNPRFITLGFTIREVEGTPTVIQVRRHPEAARAGIRPGDALLNIDNIPAKEFINQKLQKPGLASDASSRFRAVANALEACWKHSQN